MEGLISLPVKEIIFFVQKFLKIVKKYLFCRSFDTLLSRNFAGPFLRSFSFLYRGSLTDIYIYPYISNYIYLKSGSYF